MANSIPCASLYVGDLHPDVTEAILYEKFQQHGNVLSIRVCRDLVTRKSLGYAYVNYQSPNEAKAAMEQMNFEDILGRPCRIMWSQRDPASRRSGVGNIFIKNLDGTITVKEINDTFANFGDITSCKLQTDDTGNSKGFAFVNFSREEDAEKAIQAINGKIIREKIVFVAKFVPRNQRVTQVKDYTNCYIKNFGTNLDDNGLKGLFEPYGEIVSAKVMVDKDNISKGFGFVSFKEHDSAVKATTELNGRLVGEKSIFVGRAMKKAERQRELKAKYEKIRLERMQQHKSGVNLYIKNLGNDIDDSRLRTEFAVYGNITSAKVMLNKENSTSKGFGFVCFSAPDEATRAVSEMNGKIVDGKPLYVALAQKKEDRVAHLRSQFQQRMTQPAAPTYNVMNMLMNPNVAAGRSFPGTRPNFNLPNRWAPNVPAANIQYMSNRNIMGSGILQPQQPNSATAALMMQNIPPQAQQASRRFMEQVRSGNMASGNARPITGNLSQQVAASSQASALTRPGISYSMMGQTGRPPIYGYPADSPQVALITQQQQANQQVPQVVEQESTNAPAPANVQEGASVERVEPNYASLIANAESVEAKQMLGERIYPLVAEIAGDDAGKITGMFLELDNADLLYMIENKQSLEVKIEEAMNVLNTHKVGGGQVGSGNGPSQ